MSCVGHFSTLIISVLDTCWHGIHICTSPILICEKKVWENVPIMIFLLSTVKPFSVMCDYYALMLIK